MAAIAKANAVAQEAHQAYVEACGGVARAVGTRVKERLRQIQRRKPRHFVRFVSGMGDWMLYVRMPEDVDVLGDTVEDAAINAVMQGALDAFGWDAVPTGDLKVVEDNFMGDLS